MSKIVLCSMVSIDGYTEGRDGDVTAMPMADGEGVGVKVDNAFGEHNADRVCAAGHLLFGATRYRGLVEYWPHQVDNPDATPHDRYIASRYAGGMPITVISDSITRDDKPVIESATAGGYGWPAPGAGAGKVMTWPVAPPTSSGPDQF